MSSNQAPVRGTTALAGQESPWSTSKAGAWIPEQALANTCKAMLCSRVGQSAIHNSTIILLFRERKDHYFIVCEELGHNDINSNSMEEMDIVQWVVLIYSCTVWTCQGGNKLARVMLEMMTYAGPKK
jgi:hypothetical protein